MLNSKRFNKIAVLMGGPSSEHDVSMRSGEAVAKGLRQAGYDVDEIEVESSSLVIPSDIDAVFIALHGTFGEDGQVQAILDDLGIPYTGAGAKASAIAFDKILTKEVLMANDIPTPAYEKVYVGSTPTLPLPLVIKPCKQGSSIGIHKVVREDELDDAIKEAFSHDTDVIAEEYICGRELTVGIVDGHILPVIEIEAPEKWYDYTAKYTAGQTKYLVPAPIDERVSEICANLAMRTYRALNVKGLGRVDILLSEENKAFVLELNSIPGFTETSLLPKAAAEAGLSFSELCDKIIQTAS